MSYTKHEFKSGDTLMASQLNEMDEQIEKNASNLSKKYEKPLGGIPSSDLADEFVKTVNGKNPVNGNVDVTAEVDPTQVEESVNRYMDSHQISAEDDRIDKYVLKKKALVKGFEEVPISNDGAYMNDSGNSVANSSWKITDFIPVSTGDMFNYKLTGYSNVVYSICGFDRNKVCVDKIVGSSSTITGVYTVPDGVKYVKFCGSNSSADNFDSNGIPIVYGSIPEKFAEVDAELELLNEKTDSALGDHDTVVAVGRNFYKSPNLVIREEFTSAGSYGAGYYFSNYMEVEAGELYTVSCNTAIYLIKYYNDVKEEVDSKIIGTIIKEITIPENVKYIRILYQASDGDMLQLAKGIMSGKYYEPLYMYPIEDESLHAVKRNSKNLLDPNVFTKGAYITSSGEVSQNAEHNAYGFIEVEEGKTYVVTSNVNGSAVFDSDKKLIKSNISFPYTVEHGEKFIRVCAPHAYAPCLQEKDTRGFDVFEDYYQYEFVSKKIDNPLNGKIWNAMGDSITEGSGTSKTYMTMIKERTGINVRGYGKSNTAIAKRNDTLTNDMCIRYADMNDDADYITIFGGTNDHGNNIPIGEWGDTSLRTEYGALKTLCEGLIKKYVGKKIGFILPLPKVNPIAGSSEVNDYSYPEESFTKYVECIKDVCARYSIPVLDLYTGSGLAPKIPEVKSAMMPDGLHPNLAGHEMISWKIQKFLESL